MNAGIHQLSVGQDFNAEPLLISAVQAAEMLSISQRTLFSLTKSGVVPHRRLSHRVLYSPHELRDWISTGCKAVMGEATPDSESA